MPIHEGNSMKCAMSFFISATLFILSCKDESFKAGSGPTDTPTQSQQSSASPNGSETKKTSGGDETIVSCPDLASFDRFAALERLPELTKRCTGSGKFYYTDSSNNPVCVEVPPVVGFACNNKGVRERMIELNIPTNSFDAAASRPNSYLLNCGEKDDGKTILIQLIDYEIVGGECRFSDTIITGCFGPPIADDATAEDRRIHNRACLGVL